MLDPLSMFPTNDMGNVLRGSSCAGLFAAKWGNSYNDFIMFDLFLQVLAILSRHRLQLHIKSRDVLALLILLRIISSLRETNVRPFVFIRMRHLLPPQFVPESPLSGVWRESVPAGPWYSHGVPSVGGGGTGWFCFQQLPSLLLQQRPKWRCDFANTSTAFSVTVTYITMCRKIWQDA